MIKYIHKFFIRREIQELELQLFLQEIGYREYIKELDSYEQQLKALR